MPTPVPMMAASASGLSITRCEPNLRWRSSVTRKTPPSTPTSSPRITTSGSRSISWKSARFSALTMLSFVMSSPPREPLAAHRRGARRRRRLLGRGRGALAEPAGELLALRAEVRRQLGVHVVEHRQRIGRRCRLEAPHGERYLLVHPLLEAVFEEALLPHVGGEAGERVLLLPHLHLFLGAVLGRVIGRGVDAEAVGDALDQRRPLACARALHRLTRGRVHGEHVVPVHLDPWQAVGERLLGDRLRVRLLLERHRDRPLVVLADEHDGHMPDAREVERFVAIALAGGAVAEVRHHHRVLAAILRGVGEADRVRELRPDGDRDRQVALAGSRLATLHVAGEEEQELLDGPAPADHRGGLAKGRYHPVRRPEREDAAQLGRLLTLDRREGADAALALQAHHALVEAATEDHEAV